MDIKELLFRKYFNQGNYHFACGEYLDAYINFQKASAYQKTRLIYLLIARTLFCLKHYKQAFENIQIAKKLIVESENATYLQDLRNTMMKVMKPKFVLPTINEETDVEDFNRYNKKHEDSNAESIFNRSIDSEKQLYPNYDNPEWIDEYLPEPAEIEDDCTDDLLLEHLWKLEDDDFDDSWDSDNTLTGSSSDLSFDTDIEIIINDEQGKQDASDDENKNSE
ncbi:hypothetical protein PVAND_013009 [Polypedilum vanderplanki]|uniref:Uncharacterized protein n=1 Tax=Polypedilum vanderplanki TaxID=319348 RepID=A0A9J6CP59_POLVA|nr:hypothetical protein PVAND_013009 [Polypedilum vanderplanki]